MIGQWTNEMEFTDVCWSTFVSVCAALSVGALTRGLEGSSAANTYPFNLVSSLLNTWLLIHVFYRLATRSYCIFTLFLSPIRTKGLRPAQTNTHS